ncbi:conserved hypothetical protein [Desulfamplus magnetovallimortis]|uniref:Transcription factor zinc-finger domain-containing protein n=1 Tax=Desulfamplus magnetovallimortis TaxID=1246637 RepID=A0A1W1H9J8_9BACT|nr:zf-TFIIB domain-containing protein [Desulfamplus magnetovallimortis]SLM29116.1 conserved hypothetical protein [Desulfamplus magnetovallimortis]
MSKCINCSAPLPPNSITCEYCGSRNDTDLMGVHTYTTHELESGRTCPRCNITLQTIDLKINGRFFIERCDQCMGLFFDPGELELLLEESVKNVYDINLEKLDNINTAMTPDKIKITYIKCPVCRKFMNRMNFGTRSGVIVDRCREHGIWLDGGELRHLFEWKKAGGSLLHDKRELERMEEEQLQKEREERQRSMEYASWTDNPMGHGTRDENLGTVIKGVLSWLF